MADRHIHSHRFSERGIRAAAYITCLVCLGWAGPSIQAVELTLQPSVAAGGQYNDNLRLTTAPHDSVWAYVAEPRLVLDADAAAWKNRLDALMRARRYDDESQLDFNDRYLSYRNRFEGVRSLWQFDVDASKTSTLTTEIEELGLVQVSKARTQWGVRPSWSFALTPVTTIELRHDHIEVTYEDALAIGLTDYRYRTSSARLIHRVSEIDLISLTGYGASYRAESTFVDSLDRGLQLGWEREFTSTTTGEFSIGAHRSEVTAVGFDDDQSGGVAQIGLAQRWTRAGWRIGANRSVTPSGAGTLNRTDSGVLSADYMLSPKLRFFAAANAYRTEALNVAVSNLDRRYRRLRLALRWAWAANWTLDVATSYANQRYKIAASDADATVFDVRVAYAWPETRLSQ